MPVSLLVGDAETLCSLKRLESIVMGLEQIWLFEKLIKRYKMKPITTALEVGFLLIVLLLFCFFGMGFLAEKGRQAA